MKGKNILIVGCLIFLLLLSSTSLAAPPQKTADDGELYLNNYQENLITSAQLLDILRDDSVADPLIIDVRTYEDYNNRRIPGAQWVAYADEMGSEESEQELRSLLDEHIASGGANEIVVYCYTGHSSGLVAGVLGARGFNVKNLRFGFNIGWVGNQEAPASVMGPIEKVPGAEDPPGKVILDVLSPRAPIIPPENLPISPRVNDLAGKTIGLYDNGKTGFTEFLDEVEKLLKEKYPTATIIRYSGGFDLGDQMAAQVAEEVDTFIYGSGD